MSQPVRLLVLSWLLLLALAPTDARAAPGYSISVRALEPPREVPDSIRKLLSGRAVQFFENEELVLELWFRTEVPVKATKVQFENGLTYREVPSSTVMAALRVVKEINDYRKQKLVPGVYTLRLAIQPADGDHAETAPTTDFCLVCPIANDTRPDLLEVKDLRELSARLTEGKHPSPLLLFPGKGAKSVPVLVDKGEGHRVLLIELDAKSEAAKGKLQIGLTLVGASSKI